MDRKAVSMWKVTKNLILTDVCVIALFWLIPSVKMPALLLGVLCAIGYSGAAVDVHAVDVAFASAAGSIDVCRNGAGIPVDEDKAKGILSEKEIVIDIRLHDGDAAAVAFGCDLTYEYVKINGDYRS